MAIIIDAEFVEVRPSELEDVAIEDEKAYRRSLRSIAIVSAVPVLLTAGLWAFAAFGQ